MNTFKFYIIKIIIVSSVVQLGGLLITDNGFKKLFKLIGSVMLLVSIASVPGCDKQFDVNTNSQYNINISDFNSINEEFTENVEKIIENDLKERFSLEFFRVKVTSDYYTMKIYVNGMFSEAEKIEIEKHLKTTYCTSHDEVNVNNEFY
ncbi:MAG: hypothetical protein II998_04925 [Clostridia bacterium]|nr:hypothetical protein [Clostridia bacterium]